MAQLSRSFLTPPPVTALAALTQQRFVGPIMPPSGRGMVALGVAGGMLLPGCCAGECSGIIVVETGAAVTRAERPVGCERLRRSSGARRR